MSPIFSYVVAENLFYSSIFNQETGTWSNFRFKKKTAKSAVMVSTCTWISPIEFVLYFLHGWSTCFRPSTCTFFIRRRERGQKFRFQMKTAKDVIMVSTCTGLYIAFLAALHDPTYSYSRKPEL